VLLPINPVLLLLTVKHCSSDPRSQCMVLPLLLLCIVAAAPQPYSADELREFIAYARARINPEMRPEAEVRLVESYKELRKQSRADHVSCQVEQRSGSEQLSLHCHHAVSCLTEGAAECC
jgi:hypothetical protein